MKHHILTDIEYILERNDIFCEGDDQQSATDIIVEGNTLKLERYVDYEILHDLIETGCILIAFAHVNLMSTCTYITHLDIKCSFERNSFGGLAYDYAMVDINVTFNLMNN